MCRYRTTAEDFAIIGPAIGTLWERPVIEAILVDKLPDHTQDDVAELSDCEIGTIEWELSVLPAMRVIRLCGGWREYAKQVMGPIL